MMLQLRSTTVKMSKYFLLTERMLTQSIFGNLPHFMLVWRSYPSVEMKRRMEAVSDDNDEDNDDEENDDNNDDDDDDNNDNDHNNDKTPKTTRSRRRQWQ